MQHVTNLSAECLMELEEKARRLTQQGSELVEALAIQNIRNEIAGVFEENYDLGRVIDVYEIFGGYVNRSFGLVCEKVGRRTNYFVRKFNLATTEIDVQYEHKLIDYVKENGFPEIAWAYANKNGSTYVVQDERVDGRFRPRLYAVYIYLEGEDKHSWAKANATPNELRSLGAMHARYHNAGRDFDEGSLKKEEPRIDQFYKTFPEAFKEMASRPFKDSYFHDYFNETLPKIQELLKTCIIPDEAWAKMPLTTVHGDFHAGNLKFVGEDAKSMFDLDWAKTNYRLFDVCLTAMYVAQSWKADDDGRLRLDDCRNYLEGYNQTLRELGGLEPFNETEKEWFVRMFHVGNLFLVNWCTDGWYYQDPSAHNDYEGQRYMNHFLSSFPQIDDQRVELEALIRQV
jgi:homoserine kinase type II